MTDQPRYDVYEPNAFFADHRAMRPAVSGALSQERVRLHAVDPAQDLDAGTWVEELPVSLTRPLLDTGREHFEIACSPCHGLLANGESIVARNMRLRPPPSLLAPHEHSRELAPAASQQPARPTGVLPHPPGFYFAVITHGFGLMPSYADMLTPEERWAVVAYLMALARSQAAPLDSAPAEVRAQLFQGGGSP